MIPTGGMTLQEKRDAFVDALAKCLVEWMNPLATPGQEESEMAKRTAARALVAAHAEEFRSKVDEIAKKRGPDVGKLYAPAPSEPSPSVPEAQVHMIEHELTLILAHIIRVQEGATRDYNNIWIQQRAENALAHWKLERRAHEEMAERVRRAKEALSSRHGEHSPHVGNSPGCAGCTALAILEGGNV